MHFLKILNSKNIFPKYYNEAQSNSAGILFLFVLFPPLHFFKQYRRFRQAARQSGHFSTIVFHRLFRGITYHTCYKLCIPSSLKIDSAFRKCLTLFIFACTDFCFFLLHLLFEETVEYSSYFYDSFSFLLQNVIFIYPFL